MDDFDEFEDLEEYGLGFPKQKEKASIFNFLNKVLKTEDTSKVGNIDEEELRVTRLLQSTASYANAWGLPDVEGYLVKEGEIILATSDSKKGFLVSTAITSKKQIERKDRNKEKSGGSKWFGKKKEQEMEE